MNNMKRIFLSTVLFFCVASLTAQVLRTHTIDTKDNLETIAQRYGVLPEDISALTPDIDDVLSVGKILVIPNPIEGNLARRLSNRKSDFRWWAERD